MTEFVQLHLLTSYPPANLNRDDTGRPKTALMGGVPRGRISSQSLKRAFRTSPVFAEKLEGSIGQRTKRFGDMAVELLVKGGKKEAEAQKIARKLVENYGKLVADDKLAHHEQLVFISPGEQKTLEKAVADVLSGKDVESLVPTKDVTAADIAMFGRMLANTPDANLEAAVQVAHAITTHKIVVEDDYFTAVDDLKTSGDDAGASHIGQTEFFAGLFYTYICINVDLLVENLGGNKTLAKQAITALVEAAATASPSGKQASFASRAYTNYIMAERGEQQPRSLSVAFLSPVRKTGEYLSASVEQLETAQKDFDAAFGAVARERKTLNVSEKKGTLKEIADFAAAAVDKVPMTQQVSKAA